MDHGLPAVFLAVVAVCLVVCVVAVGIRRARTRGTVVVQGRVVQVTGVLMAQVTFD